MPHATVTVMRSTNLQNVWVIAALLTACSLALGQSQRHEVSGQVTDPQSSVVSSARITLIQKGSQRVWAARTDSTGQFTLQVPASGLYAIKVNAPGFRDVIKTITVEDTPTVVNLQLSVVAQRQDTISVVADVKEASILFPDPAQRVYVHQEILDANPGRPGAPLSIPGVPIETASGGIKAPQYFAPGVAGDHG